MEKKYVFEIVYDLNRDNTIDLMQYPFGMSLSRKLMELAKRKEKKKIAMAKEVDGTKLFIEKIIETAEGDGWELEFVIEKAKPEWASEPIIGFDATLTFKEVALRDEEFEIGPWRVRFVPVADLHAESVYEKYGGRAQKKRLK